MWHKRMMAVTTIIGVIILIAGVSFTAGVNTAQDPSGFVASRIPMMGSTTNTPPHYPASTMPDKLKEDFRVFWDVWNIVEQEFVGDVDEQALIQGAMKGMVEALGDPYTRYVDPSHNSILREDVSGEFQGIGAMVDMIHDQLMVVSAIKGSPAERAGLKSGDIVLEVNGKSIENMGLMDAVALVRGPTGSSVTLTLKRDNVPEAFELSIIRAAVSIVSVESEIISDKIGYLAIRTFSTRTIQELDQHLRQLDTANISALILDLRGNPGGFLDTAVATVSRFVESGPALWWVDADGSSRPIQVRRNKTYNWPMVVLIDQGSASASEIVAGALQDSGKSILIGMPSFGKGSVQNVHQLEDGSSMRVTSAHWLTRDQNEIDGVGLRPDMLVTQDENRPHLDLQLNFAKNVLHRRIRIPEPSLFEF